MRARLVCAVVALTLFACTSEEEKPAPPPSSGRAGPRAPAPASSPAAAPQGAIVIKGSKTSDSGSDKATRPEDLERIERLKASALGSQGKHESGDPIKPGSRGAGTALVASFSRWTASSENAARRAHDESKLIMGFFWSTDPAGVCTKLRTEVFGSQDFSTWAAQYVVLLDVDCSPTTPQRAQNEKIVAFFGVRVVPTVVFFDTAGKVYGSLGYKPGGAAVWLQDAQTIVDTYHP